ncbi:MAG: S-ribosylhomocysteine lyase [Acholeplasmatales bacterium]|jgi:S-ribosylhomocysteine lyase LuxS involved in autoinducer biosynthesis|nr:S-ribosylhomocysteine lyase [Acholeplasmatales bacterium]
MTKSFSIDHTTLERGFYFQEEKENVFIYDFRIYAPKEKKYLTPLENHTLEHYLANYLNERKEYKKVAIFPYGCLTGFGLVLGVRLLEDEVVEMLKSFLEYGFNNSLIPGNSIYECGNPATLNYSSLIDILKVIEKDLLNNNYSFTYLKDTH